MRPFATWRWLWYGFARWDWDEPSRRQRVICAAAGPLTTLVLTLVYGFLGATTGRFLGVLFIFLALGGAWTFVVTALPLRYGRFFGPYAGRTSDGYSIREALTP